MKTVTVVNEKGGICKTTICRNLAYLLATNYGKRVLLIDLDSSGNLSSFFGCKPARDDTHGATTVVTDIESDPNEHIVPTRIDGVCILPGNGTLARADYQIKTNASTPQQSRLSYQLKKVADQYDYCIIDCPPTVKDAILVFNALVSSEDVIIPCTPNFDAIMGIGEVMQMVNETNRWWNDKLTIRGVAFSRIVPRRAVDRQLLEQKLPVPRFRTYIREGAVADKSRNAGLSFCECDAKSASAIDMDNFAAEFLGVAYPHPDKLPDELPEF